MHLPIQWYIIRDKENKALIYVTLKVNTGTHDTYQKA